MDLSSELRKIQQQKHSNNSNNNSSNQSNNNNKPDESKMDIDIPANPPSQSTNPQPMISDEIPELKDNISNNTSNNDEKIDWDLEIAAQLQQQYNHENEEIEPNEPNNNQNMSQQMHAQQRQQQNRPMQQNMGNQQIPNRNNNNNGNRFGLFDQIFGGNMFGNDANQANRNSFGTLFDQMIERRSQNVAENTSNNRAQFGNVNNGNNNDNNEPNRPNNGNYSFTFSSSSNGPGGFSMVFRSNSSNNNNVRRTIINGREVENNDEIPEELQQMLNQMNQGIFNHNGFPGILQNMQGQNIQGMDFEQLLQHFPIINRGLNEDEINNNSMVDEYKPKHKTKDESKTDETEKTVKKDEKKKKKAKNETNENCSICLESFKEGDSIRRLPCLHIFHKDEIDKWLKTKDACPICRVSIKQ